MNQYNDNSSIVHEKLYDSTTGNPIMIPTTDVQECNNHGIISLSLIPNESEGLEFPDLLNMHEVYNAEDIIEENDFYCNYGRAELYLHKSKWNQKIKVKYMGKGISFIGANRIYTQRDKNGAVTETLDYIIEKGWEAIEALEVIGDATIVVKELKEAIVEGNKILQNLDEVVQKIDAIGKDFITITPTMWSSTADSDGFYSYVWNHGYNTENIILECYIVNTDGSESSALTPYDILDNNKIKIYNDDKTQTIKMCKI